MFQRGSLGSLPKSNTPGEGVEGDGVEEGDEGAVTSRVSAVRSSTAPRNSRSARSRATWASQKARNARRRSLAAFFNSFMLLNFDI